MAERVRASQVKREIVAREYGHWCNTCSLPSGMRVYVAVTLGRVNMHLQTHLVCDDCGGTDITVDPDARAREV